MAAQTDQPLVRTIDHTISLPIFEGPLDLLLFLIRKNELDIYDIQIEVVTRQYLDILHKMEELSLEIAGEFFVMAATLMVIKSRTLLPKEEQVLMEDEDESDIDPRWELVQQLIQYKKFKEASGSLNQLIEEAQNIVFRDYHYKAEDKPERPLKPADSIQLWNIFNQVLRRLSEKITIGQIHDDTVTVAERMEAILYRISRKKAFHFSELITEEKEPSINFMISTFLALLELTRMKRLTLVQDQNFGDILCEVRDDDEALFAKPSEEELSDLTYN